MILNFYNTKAIQNGNKNTQELSFEPRRKAAKINFLI